MCEGRAVFYLVVRMSFHFFWKYLCWYCVHYQPKPKSAIFLLINISWMSDNLADIVDIEKTNFRFTFCKWSFCEAALSEWMQLNQIHAAKPFQKCLYSLLRIHFILSTWRASVPLEATLSLDAPCRLCQQRGLQHDPMQRQILSHTKNK